MGLKLITPPTTTPITLAEAKAHLRVDHTDEDALIAALLQSVTDAAEIFSGRAFVDQTWDLYLDAFPTENDKEIKIPKPPLIQVVHVAYSDSTGNEQYVSANDYYVDSVSEPGWVVLQGGASWPSTLDAINAVRIRFRAGYVSANSPDSPDVPDDIKAALKLSLGSLYENRESVMSGQPIYSLPWGAEQLLRQRRIEKSMA